MNKTIRKDVKQVQWLTALGLPVLGALNTFAYAPFSFWWLPFLTLSLFLYTIHTSTTAKQAGYRGLLFGLGWFGAGVSWIHVAIADFGGLPLVASLLVMGLLVLYLALFPAGFAWSYKRFSKYINWLALPFLWLSWETLRATLFTGFPWLSVGYTQIEGPLRSYAPVIGEFGLQGLVVTISTIGAYLINQTLHRKSFKASVIKRVGLISTVFVIFLGSLLLNTIQWTGEVTRSVKAALVQGNIAQSIKWQPENEWPTMQSYLSLSAPYFDDHDLIIWPEAAVPRLEILSVDYLKEVDQLSVESKTALITGIVDYQPDTTEAYNNIIVLGQKHHGDTTGQYRYGHNNRFNKHHLLPIGEFVPFESVLRQVAPLFDLPMSSFSRGYYRQDNLVANGLRLSPAICFEIAFARQVSANIYASSDVILTVSNDAWFGSSIGPWQHLQIAQMRALEFAKPVIRVTNNGVTAVIDNDGEIRAQLPQFEQAVLSQTIDIRPSSTLYYKAGNTPTWALVLLLLIICLIQHKVFQWRPQA